MIEAAINRRMTAPGITIIEDAPMSAIIRSRGARVEGLAKLGEALGAMLPLTPNKCVRTTELKICWLAPSEWAVFGIPHMELEQKVAAAYGDQIHHVADMKDAWRRWRLSGAGARDLLARGISLDMHPNAFGENVCARTLLGQVGVLLTRSSESWSIHAEAALSKHIWTWFLQAGRELNLGEV